MPSSTRRRRSNGQRGVTLGVYLSAADAAEIRLRARVAQTPVSVEIARAVRYWLADDRSEEALGEADAGDRAA